MIPIQYAEIAVELDRQLTVEQLAAAVALRHAEIQALIQEAVRELEPTSPAAN